jgi:hypothetical protein
MTAKLEELVNLTFAECDPDALTDDGLAALAGLASRDDYEGCALLSCHRTDDEATEVLVIDVFVELGQADAVNDVREREPVAILTGPTHTIPAVYPLRSDFPQHIPHMNLNYRGRRRSLCLFDAHAEDIAHLFNPAMLVERVRWWMQKSAYGELHGDDQPLDPALAPSFWSLVLPPDFDGTSDGSYAALPQTKHLLAPIMLVPWDENLSPDVAQYACSYVVTGPADHGAMIDLPSNVAELFEIYNELGVDLASRIRTYFDADLNDASLVRKLRNSLLLLVTTPLTDVEGRVGAKTTRAFLSPDVSLLDVASALGIASDGGNAIARLVGQPADHETLRSYQIMPLNVVDGFTPDLARSASNLTEIPTAKCAAIGVGALGSQTVLNLARMGQSKWQLIDRDFVAPHNLARHAAPGALIGFSKAEVMAQEINGLYQRANAIAHHAAIDGDDTEEPVVAALQECERIFDFSASIGAARWLAYSAHFQAPVSSYFVNPSGMALIALHEGANRHGRDGLVEMVYYTLLMTEEKFHAHFETAGQLRIGSCRDVSVAIPQSRMAMFAGLASGDAEATHKLADPRVSIWSFDTGGEITVHHKPVPQFASITLGEWTVKVAPNVAEAIQHARGDGDIETGGILLGGFDLERQTLFVTAALPSPGDSRAGRTYFERGARGVQNAIRNAETITMRHITYIGEWHTHPAVSSSHPSGLDRTLLGWVADLRQLFLMPGLLLILGDDGLRAVLQKEGYSSEGLL